ncbi:hypothetical protein ACFL4U_02165 [Candidatus Neomarinimicrobiota bacterium]
MLNEISHSIPSKSRQILCYSIIKEGHYGDWERALQVLTGCRVLKTFWSELFMLFTRRKIIYLDADQKHLIFVPLMLLRELWGGQNYLISIRTEYLLFPTLKGAVKRKIYAFLKRYSAASIISIHKGVQTDRYKQYITDYIYDLQYWDLPYMDTEQQLPPELQDWQPEKPVVLFIGALNDKKSRMELLEFLDRNDTLQFYLVIAGRIMLQDQELLEQHPDCILINRYVENPEMFYLYSQADVIYSFYTPDTNRPSGIFGRAIQFCKPVIVRKGGFLHLTNQEYEGLIPIDDIEELNRKCNDHLPTITGGNQFDDSRTLLGILGDMHTIE